MQRSGSGGTEGGVGLFLGGFALSILSTYLFFDSIRVTTGGGGMLSRAVLGWSGGGLFGGTTTSMGVIFVPFIVAVIALFYDARQKWAWPLFWVGLLIVAVEVLSSLRFNTSMKLSTLMLMLGMFAAGVGMMLRSYRPLPPASPPPVEPAKPSAP